MPCDLSAFATDGTGDAIESKIDLGVHKNLSVEQEEYCFDIACFEEGANLLINSPEQMFTEKLRSLLKFGTFSTRYKDVFDMCYLSERVDPAKLRSYMDTYIFSDPGMRDPDRNGSGMMIMKESMTMKHMKHWMTVLAALVLALMMTVGAFAEALPVEEPAELFGDPWVNSMVIGNLPETAPDLKDDFYAAVNYDVLAANQNGIYMPMMTAAAEVEAVVTALLQDGSAAGDDIAQLKIFWEQAADMDALRAAGYSEVNLYLERISEATSLEELNAVLTAEDFPFSPYLTMPVAPLSLNEENGVWIYPALSLTSDFLNGMNNYTEPATDAASLYQKISSLDRTEYLLGVLTALGVEAENIGSTSLDLFNTEVSYISKTYSEATAALADYGYISDAPQRLSPEELAGFCSRFPLAETLKKFGKDKASAYIVLYPDWLKALDALWTKENLDKLKLLTRFKVLMEVAPFLSPDYVNEMRTQTGKAPLDKATNPWYVCNRADTFGHLLGKIYAEQVLGSELKEKLTAITQELVDTYRTLLNETEWLSAESREKALEKLDNMRMGILEPDGGYYDFSGLKLTPSSEGGTLFSNYLALKACINEQENSLIGKPAKADLAWKACNPLMANCFYDPFSNSVNVLPGFMFSYNCPKDATESQMQPVRRLRTGHRDPERSGSGDLPQQGESSGGLLQRHHRSAGCILPGYLPAGGKHRGPGRHESGRPAGENKGTGPAGFLP